MRENDDEVKAGEEFEYVAPRVMTYEGIRLARVLGDLGYTNADGGIQFVRVADVVNRASYGRPLLASTLKGWVYDGRHIRLRDAARLSLALGFDLRDIAFDSVPGRKVRPARPENTTAEIEPLIVTEAQGTRRRWRK